MNVAIERISAGHAIRISGIEEISVVPEEREESAETAGSAEKAGTEENGAVSPGRDVSECAMSVKKAECAGMMLSVCRVSVRRLASRVLQSFRQYLCARAGHGRRKRRKPKIDKDLKFNTMKDRMKVLLIGNGGREAALAWKVSRSPRLEQLYVAPGNASPFGEKVDVDVKDFPSVKKLVEEKGIDMIVVGPEQPLVDGIADFFHDTPVKVIGPCSEGARLEGSKEFAKEFMFRHGIPTARFMTVTADTLKEGMSFLESLDPPYVLKADGLAGGKGVVICENIGEAKDTLSEMIDGRFGEASSTVVIEEFLNGIECSVFVLTDGEDFAILPAAKDYKRIGEGDTGLNTGGMGAVSPVCFAGDEFMEKVRDRIVVPTVEGLRSENIDYRGVIFLGLMNVGGEPYVIEYNARFGDPETEVVLPRLKSDILELFEGIADRTLPLKKVESDPRAAVSVILASEGYPGSYAKGKEISGIEEKDDVLVFFAGAKKEGDGRILTDGGRVLAVTAYGADIAEAAARAKAEAERISFNGKYYRRDIADDLCRLQNQ